MSFTTPLLGYNRGPGSQYGGIGGAFFRSDDPWASSFGSFYGPWGGIPTRPQIQTALGITDGDVLGKVDYSFPLPTVGQGGIVIDPLLVYGSRGLPSGPHVTKSPPIPSVGAGPVDDDEAVFEPGSIFGPGQPWNVDIESSVYDIPYADSGDVQISSQDPLEQQSPGEINVAVDWGDLLGSAVLGGIPGVLNQLTGGTGGTITGGNGGYTGSVGSPPPAQVLVDTRTGKVSACHRRRRKRLLTNSDLSDLAQLQALVGKGSQAMQVAVAKAIR